MRIISMALTGYYKTLRRPRLHKPLSMMKYDPVGESPSLCSMLSLAMRDKTDALLLLLVKKHVLFLESNKTAKKAGKAS